ncbi:MFS transporter [Nocardioides lianchengensis]|uniref:Nitrate/nitrite transporter NarK n=1 Tax=Nocardioides lianchengensis TaxID=1045774 RepID=A0A1G6TRJ0_9ACTN|nr:MFS transporter [Nocardioides lianchengensis]NYG11664.1 MFS family permease [Nocardioides lianchengensis]SDD31772.1 Nitrate/nitrite transporter NarK [Nocardioides lianchengensis]
MTSTLAAPSVPDAPWRLRHGLGFWVVAAAFLAVMAFATVPTPLYAIYQQVDGLEPLAITAVFAAFAVGVMASLYLAGHLSDVLGRRPMILVSVLVEVVSAIVFLQSTALPVLLAARLLCGLGVGTLAATATAHLSELRLAARPEDGPGTAGTVAGVVNIGGLALGALVGGVLAETVDRPLHTPYLVFLVLLVVAALAVALVPETVVRAEQRPAYRPQRVAVPAAARSTFAAAGAAAFAAFAVLGLFTSLTPTFLVTVFDQRDHLVAGAVVFGVFGSASAAQVVAARWPLARQLGYGAAATAVGLAGVVAGALLPALPLFVVGGVVAGAGVGLVFKASVALAAGLAPAESRGEVLAAVFLVAYAGITLPVLAVGAALLAVSPEPVLVVFAALVAAAVAATTTRLRRTLAA